MIWVEGERRVIGGREKERGREGGRKRREERGREGEGRKGQG